MTSASGLRSGALAALMLLSLTTGADAFFQGCDKRLCSRRLQCCPVRARTCDATHISAE
jgi:hypothetical protein